MKIKNGANILSKKQLADRGFNWLKVLSLKLAGRFAPTLLVCEAKCLWWIGSSRWVTATTDISHSSHTAPEIAGVYISSKWICYYTPPRLPDISRADELTIWKYRIWFCYTSRRFGADDILIVFKHFFFFRIGQQMALNMDTVYNQQIQVTVTICPKQSVNQQGCIFLLWSSRRLHLR